MQCVDLGGRRIIKKIKEKFNDLVFDFSFEEKGTEQIFIKK